MKIEKFEQGVVVDTDASPITLIRSFETALGYLKAQMTLAEADPDWSTIEVETDTSVIETQTFAETVPDRHINKRLYVSVMAGVRDEE